MKSQKGFTLLEVLIAITILASGIVLLGNSWSGNFMRIRKSTFYYDVGALLERKMVELEAEYRGKQMAEIPENRGGDFGSESEVSKYRWELKTRDLKFPDMSAILVGKEGGADEMSLMIFRQMSDVLSKSIKEFRVTVFIKTPKKELSFSATDYLIDYDNALASIATAAGGMGGGTGGNQQQQQQQTTPGAAPTTGGVQ